MTSDKESTKALVRRFFQKVFNEQNFDVLSELLSPHYSYNGEPSSIEGNKAWVISLHSTYPGLCFSFDDILSEGEKVAIRWRMTAPAHGGRAAGYVTGTNIITFDNGQAITNVQNGALSPSWQDTHSPDMLK
jgi:predicted ester cyclase